MGNQNTMYEMMIFNNNINLLTVDNITYMDEIYEFDDSIKVDCYRILKEITSYVTVGYCNNKIYYIVDKDNKEYPIKYSNKVKITPYGCVISEF